MRIRLLMLLATLLSVQYSCRGNTAQDTIVTVARKWYVPDAATLQFAGNMGMLSGGPGYDFAKGRLTTDLLYGYVPKFDAEEAIHLLTVKGTYKPWEIERRRSFTVTPLQVGLGLSYYFDDNFPLTWDDKFPDGYYWWSPKVRLLGFAGAAVSRKIQNSYVKKIGLYSEVGTFDLLVTSWYKDDELTLWEIMNISVGTRVSF
ncbi:hypothetical protein [Pontibacter fetidus]|uniref:Outer membrane protein beta-barrel domain-containing protein n=1 Tax=Pontibacter fetidus TaxID=2700082 RepID=A0A6B2H6U2_9BACT|nr:hypothetical protein [Pontibacter fetidus]NDK56576.1 hypothetical protein [Pontibacter fetidus]